MADWITKKDKATEWITKKEKPAKKTGWIVKKQPKTNWITKKEAEEHDTTAARGWITKKTKPFRGPHKGGGIAQRGLGRAFNKGGKV